MTQYTAHSAHGSDSVTRAYRIGEFLHVSSFENGEYASTALKTAAARTFARGILALADEIDGGEAEAVAEPTSKRELKVGDKVRVVRNSRLDGDKNVGDVGTLRIIDSFDDQLPYRVELADGTHWWCAEVELVDGPKGEPELADWERELLDGPSAPARSSRAKYVEEAKELYADKLAGVDQILQLAQWLAAGDE